MNEIVKTEELVISLYEICKVMDKRHDKSKVLAEEIQAKAGFGTVAKKDIVYNDKGQEIQTYHYTKRQALMIGARLDSGNIIKLVDKLEESSLPISSGNPLLDALVASQRIIDAQSIRLNEQEARMVQLEIKNDKIIEDVVELIEINTIAETKPLPRYHAVGFYQGRYGMSNHKIKEMIGVFGPKTCRCSKNIEGLVSEYQAYFIPDMDDAFSNVKSSSTKISKTKFTSPYLKGKFEIN